MSWRNTEHEQSHVCISGLDTSINRGTLASAAQTSFQRGSGRRRAARRWHRATNATTARHTSAAGKRGLVQTRFQQPVATPIERQQETLSQTAVVHTIECWRSPSTMKDTSRRTAKRCRSASRSTNKNKLHHIAISTERELASRFILVNRDKRRAKKLQTSRLQHYEVIETTQKRSLNTTTVNTNIHNSN